MIKEYDEKVEEKATKIVELAQKVEQANTYEKDVVAKKWCQVLVLENMNPSILENFPNKFELCYQWCSKNFRN